VQDRFGWNCVHRFFSCSTSTNGYEKTVTVTKEEKQGRGKKKTGELCPPVSLKKDVRLTSKAAGRTGTYPTLAETSARYTKPGMSGSLVMLVSLPV
jgi:hypothetical protein